MAVNNLNSGKRRNVGYFPFVADSLFSLSASKTSSFGWSSVIYEKDIHGECHSNILCGRWVWTMSRFRPVVHIDSRLRLMETGFSWTLMSKVALPPPASFYLWSKDVPRMGICPSFGRPHPSPARRKGPCQRGGSRLPSRLPRPFPAQPLLKLSFRRAGNENSRSLSRPAAFPSFAEEGGATQISCFISLRKRISFVDVPDDIFSAILTALNIVICFPFQNAFSDTVRFFERKTHRG